MTRGSNFIDLTGQQYGMLTVLRRGPDVQVSLSKRRTAWVCQCACGGEITARSNNLRTGGTKSCGCQLYKPQATDMTGQRFGRLVAISRDADVIRSNGKPIPTWRCVCDCGTEVVVRSVQLANGNTASCGCLRRDISRERKTVHGGKGTAEYAIWKAMRARCNNRKADNYPYYGGRGIKVCERWNDFANFLADMGPRPDGLTIERTNNDGNYEPGNCIWADMKTQSNNRRPKGCATVGARYAN